MQQCVSVNVNVRVRRRVGPVTALILSPYYGTKFMFTVGWLLVKYTLLLYVWAGKGCVIAYRWAAPRVTAAYRSWRAGAGWPGIRNALGI